MGKRLTGFRTYHHSNSLRKLIDRYESDREEAEEFTTEFSTLRHGGIHGGSCPSIYEDKQVYQKWPVKPKKNDHKGQISIRKISADE